MTDRLKLYGKSAVTKKLAAMTGTGRLPHTVIFQGEKGVGKSVCALYLAALFLCENAGNDNTSGNENAPNAVIETAGNASTTANNTGKPCGVCNACRRVFAKNHPDVIYPEKSGKSLIYNRETMRGICTDAYVKPSDADSKIYVLTDFESTDQTSQNILLKIIEDPPGDVKFIFTAASTASLLPTILSRAVVINVPAATDEEAATALSELSELNIKDADGNPVSFTESDITRAVASYHGNIGDCLGFLTGGEQLTLKTRCERICDAIAKMNEYEFMASLSETSDSRENRERVLEVLRLCERVLRDALMLTLNENTENAGNMNFIGSFPEGSRAIAKRFTKSRITKIHDIIAKNAENLNFNVNTALCTSALTAEIFGTV